MNNQPRLSIIIPCRDDAQQLDTLLQLLAAADGVELIVIGPNHEFATISRICALYGATCVTLSKPRGMRLRVGAARAQAPYLWFLHADAVPDKIAVDAVIRCLDDGAIGGYFAFRFTGRRSWIKRLLEFCIAVRCRVGGIPYGDQGLFTTGMAYAQAGQHAPVALFEEVQLVRQLRRKGPFKGLSDTIGVDPRRWEHDGYLSRTLRNRFLALAYALGASSDWLNRRY